MMKYNPLLFMQRPSIALPFLCGLPVPAAIGHRLVLCLVLNNYLVPSQRLRLRVFQDSILIFLSMFSCEFFQLFGGHWFRVALLSGLSGTKSMIFSHCRHLHRRDLRRGASLTSDEFLLVFRQIGHGFSIPTFHRFPRCIL